MESNKYKTALLVMDMQTMILANYSDNSEIIQKIQSCISKARTNQIPVIYVGLGFRPGFPEVNKNNSFFSGLKNLAKTLDKNMTQIVNDLTPLPGDIIVTKKRFSAFTGSDLHMILQAGHIEHLILTGVATSGVILSTFTEAIDKDYQVTVVSDACKDRNSELHESLMEHYFPYKGNIINSEEWL